MRCPEMRVLFDVASGGTGVLRRARVLRHVHVCDACRERWRAAREEVRLGLTLLARDEGLTPPDPAALRDRVFRAVSKDRARKRRPDWRSGTLHPARPRVFIPLAAAAAALLLLAFAGSRYLGESRWNGRPDDIRGALLRPADRASYTALGADPCDFAPGDVFWLSPGGSARLELEGRATVEMRDTALVVFGEDDEGAGIFIARGNVTVVNHRDEVRLLASIAGETVEIVDTLEAEVVAGRPDHALALALRRSGEVGDTGAEPDGEGSGAGVLARVRAVGGAIHVVSAHLVIPEGYEAVLLPDGAWTTPVRSPAGAGAGEPDQRLLTDEETETVRRLLTCDSDVVDHLLDRARSEIDQADRALGRLDGSIQQILRRKSASE